MRFQFKKFKNRKQGKKITLSLLMLLIVTSGVFVPMNDTKAASCISQGNTIDTNCEFAPGTYYYNGTFTINEGKVVTMGSAATPGQVIISADDITVNGTIDANGLGDAAAALAAGRARGVCGGYSGTSGGGACHGGYGGNSSGGVEGGVAVFGSVISPTNIGSSGGDDTNTGGAQGGAGGGAVKLLTSGTGTFTLGSSGIVRADGSAGVSDQAGGGAAGSIWVDTGTAAGSGTITATGGNGFGSSTTGGGGGGGGRIALHYTTSTATYTMQAFGGTRGNPNMPSSGVTADHGGAGTIFEWDKDNSYGDLIVNNNNKIGNILTKQTAGQDYTFRNITITKGGSYLIGATNTLTVASGGTITGGGAAGAQPRLWVLGTFNAPSEQMIIAGLDIYHTGTIGTLKYLTYDSGILRIDTSSALFSAGRGNRLEGLVLSATSGYTVFSASSTATLYLNTLNVQSGAIMTSATNTGIRNAVLDISTTSTATIASGATVTLDTLGFNGGTSGSIDGLGPGGGVSDFLGGGGAHGGNGGSGSNGSDLSAGGSAYDSITAPIELGSGGGHNTSTGGDGGSGGGAFKLTAGGAVTIDGNITANGGVTSGAAGGGAGGSIWINAQSQTVTGSGTFSVNGGASGSNNGGGGGGGRIAVTYTGTAPSFTYQARGGAVGFQRGGAGTIYTKSDSQTYGTLTSDNGTVWNAVYTPQTASNTGITFDAMSLKNNANYQIPSGLTMSLASSGALTGGGSFTGSLTIDGTFNAPTASWTVDGVNINQNATLGVVTALTLANTDSVHNYGSTYTVSASGVAFTANSHNRLVNLTVGSGTTFSASTTAIFYLDTLTVNSGGLVTSASNTGDLINKLTISATSSITVNSGGAIDVRGKGYPKRNGLGVGTTNGTAGGGGGYGGVGGTGSSGAAGGVEYGNGAVPIDIGSGGGGTTSTNGGGDGGGYIKLLTLTSGSITINGTISASGTKGSASFAGGGGAGGTVWIESGTVTQTAPVTASGSVGGTANGGCGGGGRIVIKYSSHINSSTATADTGCTGARAGAMGSVYIFTGDTPPTVTSVTHSPDPAEIGQNIVLQGTATDNIGVSKIEIYLDGTDPGHLVQTCNFSPVTTPASCQYEEGALSAGSHTTTVIAYDGLDNTDTDEETFSVANLTTSNRFDLSRTKKGETAIFSLSFSQASTSSGTLVITFPTGFTVNSALTSGSACLSSFGFTASTLTATETNCTGTVTMTGASVTNPPEAGAYTIVFTDDNGSGTVYIVEDDEFHISASVDPIITFNVGAQTAACDGTFSGAGGTVGFGTLVTSAVATSDVSSVPHICMRLSTNATGGAIITVKSQNASLKSTSAPSDTIPSSSATLVAGTAGYGICVGSGGSDTGRDTTVPVGAAPTAASPFNGSCSTSTHAVGAVTTSAQTVWSVSDPTQNAFARIFAKASIASSTLPHNDYTDVLTFIATATY